MDRILKILKKENGPRASSAPALELNTIIFKHVYWFMQLISGERLQDHWSSGFNIVEALASTYCLGRCISGCISSLQLICRNYLSISVTMWLLWLRLWLRLDYRYRKIKCYNWQKQGQITPNIELFNTHVQMLLLKHIFHDFSAFEQLSINIYIFLKPP